MTDDNLDKSTWSVNHFICLLPYRKQNYDEIIEKNKITFEIEKRPLSLSKDIDEEKSLKKKYFIKIF